MVDRLVNSEANSRRITNVESCFGMSGVGLVLPGRVLVGEGVLTKMCRKRPKPRQVFLFNDILVYGSIIINKKKYNRQHIIPLETVKLENLPDGELKNGWQIKTPTKSFVVYAATATEKSEWMAHINKCVEELILKTGNRPVAEHAAVWVPDNETRFCMSCQKTKFTALNRRHHCRNCGNVVCGSCSKNKFVIATQSSKPLRVCNTCYDSLAKSRTCYDNPTAGIGVRQFETDRDGTSIDKNVMVNIESSDSEDESNGKSTDDLNKSLENLTLVEDDKPTFYSNIDQN